MTFPRRHVRSTRAMMLMELMIVVAIILVMFTLYWGGSLNRKTNKQKDFGGCAKNLQFIHTSLMTYAADHNDKFPTVPRAETSEAPLSELIPKYTSQTASFICPASDDKALPESESFAKRKISYAYVMGLSSTNDPTQWIMSDEQIDAKPKGEHDKIFATTNQPPANNHGPFGGNFLLLDGSIRQSGAKAAFPVTFTNATFLNPKPKPR